MEKTIQNSPKQISKLGYSDLISSASEINTLLLVHKLIGISKACQSIVLGMHKDVIYDPSLELHRYVEDEDLSDEFLFADPDLITYVAVSSQVARLKPTELLKACKANLHLFKGAINSLADKSRKAYDLAIDTAVAAALEDHVRTIRARIGKAS